TFSSTSRGTRRRTGSEQPAAVAAKTQIAVAALVRDGLLRMVHAHALRQWYPDCWDLVGGHVDLGESPHQAVRRECREELGVDVHDPRPFAMTVMDPTLE